MFKIYHSKKWELNSQLHFLNCEFYVVHPDLYIHVADVDCKAVGETFQLTNHIDNDWWENDKVELIGLPKHRSTSVGDVVEDMETGKLWLCCGVGWQQVSWTDDLTDVLDFFKEEMRIFFKDCKLEEVKDRIDELCQQIESIFALSVKENEAENENEEDKFYSDLFNHWGVDINDANKKMCTGCRQMYIPIMKNDDDCCPSCARF